PLLGETLRDTMVPTISTDNGYIATLVAILGTTISPYLFFWQTSQEVEEERAAGRKTREERRGASRFELRIATIDVTIGMLVSNLIMYFIMLATVHRRRADRRLLLHVGRERCRGAISPRRHHAGRPQRKGHGGADNRACSYDTWVDHDHRDVRGARRSRAHLVWALDRAEG